MSVRQRAKVLFQTLDARTRAIGAARLFWTATVLQLAFIGIILCTPFLPQAARLSVVAKTDVLLIDVAKDDVVDSWGEIPSVSVVSGANACSNAVMLFNSQLKGAFKIVAQAAPTGALTVAFAGDSAPFGSFTCADGRKFKADSDLILTFDPERAKTLVLPFVGQLTLGADISSGMNDQKILRSGKVYVAASSAPFHGGEVTSETKLFAGDRLFLASDNRGNDQAISHGVMRVEDRTISVTAHATAVQAEVLHYGQDKTTPTSFAPSFWSKLQAQSQWSLILVALAILINILTGLQTYIFEKDVEVRVNTGKPDEHNA